MSAASLSVTDVGDGMEGRQLELEFFEQLDEAVRLPEDMSVSDLLQQLDMTLDGVPVSQQMVVAGEALIKIVTAFSERAELLLLDWEDRCHGPLVDGDWLAGLVGRSPTFELAAYESAEVELPRSPEQSKASIAKRIRYISKAEALAEIDEPHSIHEIVRQAHQENVGETEAAILVALRGSNKSAGLVGLAAKVADGNVLLVLLVALLSSRTQLRVSSSRFYVGFGDVRIAAI